MKNNLIRATLDQWDYPTALDLLQRYGDQGLHTVLSRGENKFFTRKLREALINLLDPEQNESTPAQLAQASCLCPSSKPEGVKAIEQKRNRALSHQDALRGRLVLLVEQKAPQSAIAPVAIEIKQLSKELRGYWDQLYYYEQHGMLPPPTPDPIMAAFEGIHSVSDLTRIRNNARTNVSRAKSQEKKDYWKAVITEADRRINQEEV